MNRLLVATVAAMTTWGLMPQAKAGFYDGYRLHEFCAAQRITDEVYCMGYIAGVAEALSEGNTLYGFRACIETGVTKGQITDTVFRFLRNRPEVRDLDGVRLVTEALREAYPCQGQQQR